MNKGVGDLIDKIPGMPSMPDPDSIFLQNLRMIGGSDGGYNTGGRDYLQL